MLLRHLKLCHTWSKLRRAAYREYGQGTIHYWVYCFEPKNGTIMVISPVCDVTQPEIFLSFRRQKEKHTLPRKQYGADITTLCTAQAAYEIVNCNTTSMSATVKHHHVSKQLGCIRMIFSYLFLRCPQQSLFKCRNLIISFCNALLIFY